MELIGTVQFTVNSKRGNPVALFLEQSEGECRITSRLPQWRHIVGTGATVNKAAGNFEANLKAALPSEGAYDGPSWNGGIKAEKPTPPKPSATAPAATPAAPPAPPAEGGAAPSP